MFKKLNIFFLSFLSLFTLQLSSCITKTVPFTTNYDYLRENDEESDFESNRVTFIRSKKEFVNYLSDTTIFDPVLSEEFENINKKYTEKYILTIMVIDYPLNKKIING